MYSHSVGSTSWALLMSWEVHACTCILQSSHRQNNLQTTQMHCWLWNHWTACRAAPCTAWPCSSPAWLGVAAALYAHHCWLAHTSVLLASGAHNGASFDARLHLFTSHEDLHLACYCLALHTLCCLPACLVPYFIGTFTAALKIFSSTYVFHSHPMLQCTVGMYVYAHRWKQISSRQAMQTGSDTSMGLCVSW